MNLVKTMLLAFLFGLRDSLLGAISLFTIDKDSVGLSGPKSSRKEEEKEVRVGRPPERRGQRPPPKNEYDCTMILYLPLLSLCLSLLKSLLTLLKCIQRQRR